MKKVKNCREFFFTKYVLSDHLHRAFQECVNGTEDVQLRLAEKCLEMSLPEVSVYEILATLVQTWKR